VKLLSLSIERLEGLRTGFALGPEHLTGRVRVLHGPNAIGKSSVLRALKCLLWPREAPARGSIELEARFEIQGNEWTVRREGASTRWMRDGNVADAPPLPAWRHASQMLVGLDALGLGGDREVREHVQREMGGGYDIAGAETALRPGVQVGRTQAGHLSKAEDELRAAQFAQQEVIRDADTLDEVRRARNASLGAGKRVVLLDKALELAQAKRALALTESRLAEFPSGLENWRGDEPDELGKLRKRLASAQSDQDRAHRAIVAVERAIARDSIAEPVPADVLDELDQRVEALRSADDAWKAALELDSRSQARLHAAGAVFGANADLDRFASLDDSLDVEVDALARATEVQARHDSEVDAQLAAIGSGSSARPPAHRATAALEDWLSAPTASASDAKPRRFLLLLAVLLALTAMGLAFVHLANLAILVLAALALFGARAKAESNESNRADHAEAYARTGEEQPTAWTVDAVRAQLAALREREVSALEARARDGRRAELTARREALADEGRGLALRRIELAARLGANPTAPDSALAAFAQSRRSLREARSASSEVRASCDLHGLQRADASASLNKTLETHGATRVEDLTAARVRLKSLRERSAELSSHRAEIEHQRGLERVVRETAQDIEKQIAIVFRRGGLESGEDVALQNRLEHLEPWRTAREDRSESARDVERLSAELNAKSADAADHALADLPEPRLESERQSARDLAEQADALTERVLKIEMMLEQARDARTLEAALEARNDRRDALSEAFTKARRGVLACALLADVRAAHEATSRPRIVEEAEKLFASFTHGRYALRVTTVDGELAFTALDAQNAARPFALDELSDGTRAQLLLASRLAYLHEIERGDPLPLVLDDALATSDPARKQEIGAALLEVARKENRQILVLTSDAADADLLRPAGTPIGEVEATDLAVVRSISTPAATRERLAAPAVARVPDVGGANAEQFAAALASAGIPVRPFDPRCEVDEVHLWWILHHDLALLQRLLTLRFDNVASFRNAARNEIAGVGAREVNAMTPWIALTSAVIDAWRIGRGRPIDRSVLERAGVSDTFIERMTALAADVHDDAKLWFAAMSDGGNERAKGYRKKTLDQNREFLVAERYLDEREILDREDVWLRVLASMPPNHGIAADEVRQRFELLWQSCTSQ